MDFNNCYKVIHLFEKYKGLLLDINLQGIISRGPVYSEVNLNANALICGINPSFRKAETNEKEGYSFNFDDENTKKDPYFKKFHELASYTDLTFTYIDLFCQRHTDQREIRNFIEDEIGLEFLCEHLVFTQEIIEMLKPKLILLFNRQAANFWGLYPKELKDKEFTNVWLGYTFEPVEGIKNAFRITGLRNSKERLNPALTDTALLGTIIYFSKFMGKFTRATEKVEIKKDVETLGKYFQSQDK